MTVILTCHPLHPYNIILVFWWCEILQVVTIVGLNAVSIITQVLLVCMEQEVLHHVCHLQFLKHRKEDAFGHSPNPRATIQSAVCACLTRALLLKNG